ncbi:MAG: aspartate-semialdehyde dehydrogenase, partial [Planctomycetota bacterium]|nr:aspartate-semialdehyde dehydrogenase [Planctomycetota bacterium]
MRTPVAILGATGMVGQVFVERLAAHPWFEPVELVASPELAGQTYGEVVAWRRPTPLDPRLAALRLVAAPGRLASPLAFSALGSDVAAQLEARYADAGTWVFSNAATHRMDADVPLVVPEVNAEHLVLALGQDRPGAIVTNPNCTTIGLTMALAPLLGSFGLRRVSLVSLQARSGAGLKQGRLMQLEDDVECLIPGEEDKLVEEPAKILGRLIDAPRPTIQALELPIAATCTRVPVTDGHTLCVSVELERPATADELSAAWSDLSPRAQTLGLPTAPTPPIHMLQGAEGPRPSRHLDLGGGMAIAIGRLRPDVVIGTHPEPRGPGPARRGWAFVTLSHNLVRGAAGGGMRNPPRAPGTRRCPRT